MALLTSSPLYKIGAILKPLCKTFLTAVILLVVLVSDELASVVDEDKLVSLL
jgi:hypothetical protein